MLAVRSSLQLLQKVGKYFEGVLGADAYQNYLAHHEQSKCQTPPMNAKEFWRDKMARQDANPEGRCC